MNTERPENDDTGADGSAEVQSARVEKDASGTEASGDVADGAAGSDREGGQDAEERDGVEDGDDAVGAGDVDTEAVGTEGVGTEGVGTEGVDAEGEQDGGEIDAADAAAERAGNTESPDSPAPVPPEPGPAALPELEPAAALHEAGADGSARHRSPAIIASVAAAVLLVGGGGAYLAANASGGSDSGTSSGTSGGDGPPPLRLDGYGSGGTEDGTEGTTGGIAPGEPNPYGVTYRADGALPTGPGSAPVYRAGGRVGEDDVARLAGALGVDGAPVAQGQAWAVGAKDGTGPRLQVNKQAPGTWTFYQYTSGTDDCRSTTVCSEGSADPAADPVSEATAKKAAAPVLRAVGQDDAKLDAGQIMDGRRVVNATPVVGGLPTYGWTTGVTVNAQGEVVGGSGRLKAPVKGDTYPVLDAEKTLGLMNAAQETDGRVGIGGCAGPVPQKDRLEAPCGTRESAGTQQSTGGTPAADTLTVEEAVFGLASHQVDGREALVPSWLFEVRERGARDGFTVTYPAIDPYYLASSTPSAEPTGQASPRPTDPKDEPTSAPVTRNVTVDGYTADGRDLTVAYTGGVCADYKVTVSESGDEVTVRVTETSQPDEVCILVAKVFHRTVRLDEPLGDRKVVGTDGRQVPQEKSRTRLPDVTKTSGAR